MPISYLQDIERDAPPDGLKGPQVALWWLAKGRYQTGPEWQKAHEIAQSREGDRYHDLVHAVVHVIEGDRKNARYWYNCAGVHAANIGPEAEVSRIAEIIAAP